MRRLIGILTCLALLTGCEPSPLEGLGTILDAPPEIPAPEIPGTDEPYEMPQLDRPAAEEKSGSQPGPSHNPKQRLPDKPADEGGLRR